MKADKKSSSAQGEQSIQPKNLEKKLRKREKRLQERLQAAQSAQTRAEERLRRAEARLQKRVARVERLEGRLAHSRQQTGEPTIAEGTSSEPPAIPQEVAAEQNAVNVVQEGDTNEQQEESSI